MKRKTGCALMALAVVGLSIGVAWADNENPPFSAKSGTGSGCIGTFTGCAKWTNSAGTLWITPTNGVSSVTFTDASQFSTNYVPVVTIMVSNDPLTPLACGTNTVTVTVTNTLKYEFISYVKSPIPPPTNGQPVNLQINWQ